MRRRPTYLERYNELIEMTQDYASQFHEVEDANVVNAGVIHTGGGCFAYEIVMEAGWMAWITDEDCDVVGLTEKTPTVLGFYIDDGNDVVGWTPNEVMIDALSISRGFQEYVSGEWPMAVFDSALDAITAFRFASIFDEVVE